MKKVLIVDDEAEIVSILQEFLKRKGFLPLAVTSGKDALGIFSQEKDISLVILDLRMPQMQGVKVLSELKKIRKDIPVVILTGVIDKGRDMEKIKELGFLPSDVLLKPVDLKNLLSLVEEKIGINL